MWRSSRSSPDNCTLELYSGSPFSAVAITFVGLALSGEDLVVVMDGRASRHALEQGPVTLAVLSTPDVDSSLPRSFTSCGSHLTLQVLTPDGFRRSATATVIFALLDVVPKASPTFDAVCHLRFSSLPQLCSGSVAVVSYSGLPAGAREIPLWQSLWTDCRVELFSWTLNSSVSVVVSSLRT